MFLLLKMQRESIPFSLGKILTYKCLLFKTVKPSKLYPAKYFFSQEFVFPVSRIPLPLLNHFLFSIYHFCFSGNLEYIFKKLYFKIERYENLTSTEMVRTMMQYSMNEEHERYDCLVCCVLTHGEEGQVFGCDGKLIRIQDLLNPFKAVSCPGLRGKPKLFFIQACQGKAKQPGIKFSQLL